MTGGPPPVAWIDAALQALDYAAPVDKVLYLARSLLFVGVAVPTSIYALRRGGAPERLTALMVLLAMAATIVAPGASYREVVVPVFVIDTALLIGIWTVTLFADRYWPLYFTAFQLLTVALHLIRMYDAAILPAVYARLGGELAYPAVAMLAIGTWRHHRRGKGGDWSWQVRRERAAAAGP